jgi:hypothetical protein
MTDTSPDALDALVKELRTAADLSECYAVTNKAADTIAALRAAPVAMRERAAAFVAAHATVCRGQVSPLSEASDPRLTAQAAASVAEHNRALKQDADRFDVIAAAIRALPLDAPAPVDPVAEARQEKDGLSEMERQLRRALAQEARHVG